MVGGGGGPAGRRVGRRRRRYNGLMSAEQLNSFFVAVNEKLEDIYVYIRAYLVKATRVKRRREKGKYKIITEKKK